MKTRPLTWSDVQCEIIHCSFVHHTMWIMNPDLENPAFKAVVLLKLQMRLRQIIHKLTTYEL